MKTFLILVLTIISTAFAVATSPRSNQPFTIRISAENPVVKAGSDVFLKIDLTNTSTRDMNCSVNFNDMTGVDSNYWYEVRDDRGNAVSKRVYAHPELASGSVHLCSIRPGESAGSGARVSGLYDMSRPGHYAIQVSRFIKYNAKDGTTKGEVKSNVITVAVTE